MLPAGRYWSAGFSAERPSLLRQVASHDGKEMEALGGLFAAVLKCALTKGFAGQYVAVDKSLGWLHQGPTVEQNLGEAVSVRGSRQRYPRFRVRSRPRVLPVPSRSPTTRDRGPTMRVPSVGWRPREPSPRLRCWEVRNERAAMIRPLPRRCRGSAHPAPRAVEMQIPLGSGSLQQATRQGCRSFTQKSAEKCGSDPQGGKDGVHVVRAAERRQLHPASSALCAESGINFGGFTEALQEARGEPPRKTGDGYARSLQFAAARGWVKSVRSGFERPDPDDPRDCHKQNRHNGPDHERSVAEKDKGKNSEQCDQDECGDTSSVAHQ